MLSLVFVIFPRFILHLTSAIFVLIAGKWPDAGSGGGGGGGGPEIITGYKQYNVVYEKAI